MELGDYTLIKSLGHGAMGESFLAEHRWTKENFFLKVLPKELGEDPDFVSRFESHARALSKLDHPHLVKMHNASMAQNSFFFVTDYLGHDSCNLLQYYRKKKGQLSEEEVLRIARQVAAALDYLHRENCVHGLLKLSNVLVGTTKEGIHTFLTDFGLAEVVGTQRWLLRSYKAVLDQMGSKTGFSWKEGTYTGQLFEEPQTAHDSFLQGFFFLAPEQKSASSDSKKADVYAFGVLLYYLLLGAYPEGFYEFPEHKKRYRWNWSALIASCLHHDPRERPDLITPCLETLLSSHSIPGKVRLDEVKERLEEKFHVPEPQARMAAATVGDSETKGSLKPLLQPQEIARPSFEPDPAAIFQIETAVGRYQPVPKEETEVEPLQTQMVVIDSGTYYRGSNTGSRDELPRHSIYLSAFAIDIHPVTNEQFVRFLEAMGGEKDVNNNDIIRLRDSRIKRAGGKLNIESGYGKHPVVGVTWYGAVAYAKWVGKRLPTEAEWEVASYGGHEDAVYPTGANIERSEANFFSSDTTVVMSYPPNSCGIYDMAGNVYEWCQDWYDYHYYDLSVQEPNNPKGPLQGVYRILRGGCWKSLKEDLRCAHRHRNNPGVMNGTYGFRCAADVSEENV